MKAVEQTSIFAYHELGDTEASQKERILAALKIGPASDKVLEKRTKMRLSSVNARRNALVKEGKVAKAYVDTDGQTGKQCVVWKLNDGVA